MIRTTESLPEAVEAHPIIPVNRLIQFCFKSGDSHQVTGEGDFYRSRSYTTIGACEWLTASISLFVSADVVFIASPEAQVQIPMLPGKENQGPAKKSGLGGNTDHGLAADAVRSRFWMGNYRSIIYNGLDWGLN
jgi:hypothetical protein